ncbi:MAG: nucleoside monophosphate kinase, partial [Patescibacteria group bacterium]
MNRKSFVFFGPPGSGKGTQAALLGKYLGLPAISLGELLRQKKNSRSHLGKKIEKYLSNGKLVPESIVLEVLRTRLNKKDVKAGFILDGYPRTKKQLSHFRQILKKTHNIHFIFIDVDDKEVKKRLGKRRSCSCGATYHLIFNPPKIKGLCDSCKKKIQIRSDDKPAVIKRRLELYHSETEPLIGG